MYLTAIVVGYILAKMHHNPVLESIDIHNKTPMIHPTWAQVPKVINSEMGDTHEAALIVQLRQLAH